MKASNRQIQTLKDEDTYTKFIDTFVKDKKVLGMMYVFQIMFGACNLKTLTKVVTQFLNNFFNLRPF